VADAEVQANRSLSAFVLIGIAALAIGVVLALMMERMIAGPLRELSRAAERVAASDLTVEVPRNNRADEVGTLMRAFGSMVESLRRTTEELNEGVGVLASSSSEILATTTQVASGAAETASAGSETTPTVEEGKQALFVVNLEPKRMMGEESEGMLFDIGHADGLVPVLAMPEKPVPAGTRAE